MEYLNSLTDRVLSEYAKIRILSLWRDSKGPIAIVEALAKEGIRTTRKPVSLFIAR